VRRRSHRRIGASAHRRIGASAHRRIGASAHRRIGASAHRRLMNNPPLTAKTPAGGRGRSNFQVSVKPSAAFKSAVLLMTLLFVGCARMWSWSPATR
jgi:hypothetical protein